jgi:hypothetical protein
MDKQRCQHHGQRSDRQNGRFHRARADRPSYAALLKKCSTLTRTLPLKAATPKVWSVKTPRLPNPREFDMNKHIKYPMALITTTCLLSACASHPNDIPTEYVSPLQYQSYNCKQLEQEMQSVSAHVSELRGQTESAASDSDAEMGVGLVLFWPALFFPDKNSAQAAEYGRLKGEFDALEKASIQRNCHFHVERPKVDTPQKKPDEKDDTSPTPSAR